jgi:phosphoglycolate phosphatase-like HAD superfamily hydrolase
MLRAIIFDFNGVIVETSDMNAQIFAQLFRPFGPEVVEKVTAHYKAYGGIPRQKRIELYLKEFAHTRPTKEVIDHISQRFSQIYLQKLQDAKIVEGVRQFLNDYYQDYAFFLSSGAPQEDLPEMLRILRISHYFIEAFGAPRDKSQHISFILQKYEFEPQQVVFVGDSPKDKEAAEKNKIWFIARDRGLESLKNEPFKIKNFYDLPAVLEEINQKSSN